MAPALDINIDKNEFLQHYLTNEELDVNILDKFIFSENGYERTGDDWNLIYNLGV